ncbi:MAG: phosphate acyltransferase [Spirochaetia bacterium]
MNLHDFLKERSPTENRKRVVIPGVRGEEIFRFLIAAEALADFILVGSTEEIQRGLGQREDAGFEVISAEDDEDACRIAGNELAAGNADLLMKGLIQTSSFTRILLNKERGFTKHGSLLSHLSLFSLPAYHKPLFLTDAAINIAPGEEEKARILGNALEGLKKLGINQPKAALIAPVEKVSEKIPSTVHAACLKKRFAGRDDVLVDGPFGLDAALSRDAAAVKGISGPVCGDPDLLLMPGLDAGNVLYKAFSLIGDADPAGVVLGASVPAVLTSRSDSVESKLLSLALALRLS